MSSPVGGQRTPLANWVRHPWPILTGRVQCRTNDFYLSLLLSGKHFLSLSLFRFPLDGNPTEWCRTNYPHPDDPGGLIYLSSFFSFSLSFPISHLIIYSLLSSTISILYIVLQPQIKVSMSKSFFMLTDSDVGATPENSKDYSPESSRARMGHYKCTKSTKELTVM